MGWDVEGNGPESQDQDYVGKTGHRPEVYVARETHATYFRNGFFRTTTNRGNHGEQYLEAPTDWSYDDETGSLGYSYELWYFDDAMASHWLGFWGDDKIIGLGRDGPPSPAYKEVGAELNVWDDPVVFHNSYLKLDAYPNGDVKYDELRIAP